MLTTFTGCFGYISLFTALEMKTAHVNSLLGCISFLIWVFLNVAAFLIQAKLFHILCKLRKSCTLNPRKGDEKKIEKLKSKIEGFEVVFEGLKDKLFLQQSFLFIFNLKIYIFYAAASYFPYTPLVPTIVNTFTGFCTLFTLSLQS